MIDTKADQLLKGCMNGENWSFAKSEWIKQCGIEDFYCPSCQVRLSQYLSDCKDNLDVFEKLRKSLIITEDIVYEIITEKIIFLKSEIKLMESKEIK